MAINYIIQAHIIDIRSDVPKTEDQFMVDTNVWYWMTYPKATSSIASQLNDYPNYLNQALGISAGIFHSGLTLAELSHIIEKTEREIYEKQARTKITPKEFRHNLAAKRGVVVSEVQAAWSQVESLAQPLDISIESQTTSAAIKRLKTESVDGYDLFILESMNNHGIAQVITDDGDFATIPGIQVFTANQNVINTARKQGKLLSRV